MSYSMTETISSVLTLDSSQLPILPQITFFREELKRKIYSSISEVEKELSVSFNYSITDSEDSVTIIDHYKEIPKTFQHQPSFFNPPAEPIYKYKMSRYQHHGKKTFKFEGNKKIKLQAKSFGFDIPQSNSSCFYIIFDDYFNIECVEFESSSKDMGKFSITKIKLKFDQNMTLSHYEYSYDRLRERLKLNIKKEKNRLMGINDEIILWKLMQNQSDDVKELIPEYYIPSAYDFNSIDFKDRMSVYDMSCL